MITKVILKNWRSHLDTEINFSEGTNCFVGHMGSGKSLPYQELVFVKKDRKWNKCKIGDIVEDSLKKAKNIFQIRDSIFTIENPDNILVQSFNPGTSKIEIRKVRSFIKHKSPSNLIKIRTRTGRIIIVTKDHSLLILTKDGIVPYKGSEVKLGDFTISAKKLYFDEVNEKVNFSDVLSDFRDTSQILKGLKLVEDGFSYSEASEISGIKEPHTLENWKLRQIKHKPGFIIGKHIELAIPKEINLCNEFSRLLGSYISEGCCEFNEDKHHYGIKITNNDSWFMDDIKDCWKKTFNFIPYNTFNNEFQVNSKVVSALFSRLCGSKSGSKIIPEFVYSFSEEYLNNFLSAYFEGDGCVTSEKEVSCSSKSLNLIDGLMTLISRWGIITKIRERNIKGEIYYDMNILTKDIPIFAQYIKFLNKQKQSKLINISTEIKNRKKWDGIDIIPNFYVKDILLSLIHEYHLYSKKNVKMRSLARSLYSYTKNENMGREKLRNVLHLVFETYKYKSPSFIILEKIVNSDIFFDEIVEVKEIPSTSEYVYDLSVEGLENFVGGIGNLVVHNTSIMDAICFALFGTFLQLQQKKLKLEDVIMKKPSSKDRAEVTVFFDIGDENEWNIKRTITKGKTTAELRKNGELVEGPQTTKVTEEIERVLKMDYDLFSRAVYSEQNQLDMFLTIPKGQRMRKIDELLAIDKFEKARSNTKSLINKCSIVLNEKELTIQNLETDESLKKLEMIKKEFLELKEKQEKMEIQLKDIERKKINTAKDVLNLKEQQKKLQLIEEEIKKFTALVDLTESDIEKLKEDLVEFAEKTDEEMRFENEKINEEVENLNKNLIEEKNNMDRLKENYAEDNAKINLIENEKIPNIERLAKEFDEISEKLKKDSLRKISSELRNNKKELEKNQMKLQKSLAQLSEIEDSINELNLAGSICPVCDSKLSKDKKLKLIEKKKKQIKNLKKETEKYSSETEKMKTLISELEKKVKEAERIQQRFEEIKDSKKELKSLEDELKDLKDKTRVFDNQRKMFEKNIGILEESIKNLKEKQERIKQILSKKEEVNNKLERLRDYRNNLMKLKTEKEMFSSFTPSVLEKIELDYQTIIGLERELQTHLGNLAEIKNEKQKLLEEIESKKKMLEGYKLEIRKISAIADQLRLLESALKATQEQLRKDFVSAVNEAMQSIWSELYPYKDIYNIKLGIEEGDYVLQLQDSTGWIPADGVASGGERSMACLALRIAFSLVLAPQLRWLVLDEPTANLDSQAIDILAIVLRERVTKLVDQCFLITHDEKLKEAVSGFCYEFIRDKSRDEVTNVTLVSSPL